MGFEEKRLPVLGIVPVLASRLLTRPVSRGPVAKGSAAKPSGAPSASLPGVPKRLVIGFTMWACAGLAGLNVLTPVVNQTRQAPPTLADLEPAPAQPVMLADRGPSQITKTLAARAGDTLSSLLRRAGLGKDEAETAVAAISRHFDPRRLKVGQDVRLTFVSLETAPGSAPRDQVVHVSVKTDVDRTVEAKRLNDGAYDVRELIAPLQVQPAVFSGTIHGSLFESATSAGLPVKTILEMIRIFSYEVDFQREIQDGDTYEVMFDRHYDESGRAVKEGDIAYAALVLSGKRFELYRYEPQDGDVDYYDAQGKSVQRALKRTPIDGARLTSSFGMRNHPILGYTRMHRGVDFAAAAGTPIQAAGSGIVEEAGRHAGYGLYVKLDHDSDLETAYGHMSRLAPGIAVGRRVHQGQIIGFVGQTGLATGPHLHYEVIKNDAQVNPATVALPSGRTLAGSEMAAFKGLVSKVMTAKAAIPSAKAPSLLAASSRSGN
jgi:murein DD-endopeptidase MepM/ murein hydrolase activator NlpD